MADTFGFQLQLLPKLPFQVWGTWPTHSTGSKWKKDQLNKANSSNNIFDMYVQFIITVIKRMLKHCYKKTNSIDSKHCTVHKPFSELV